MEVADSSPSDAVEPKRRSRLVCRVRFYRLAPASAPFADLQPYARCLNARLFERFQNDELLLADESRKYPTIGIHGGKLTTTGESQARRVVLISEADTLRFRVVRAAAAVGSSNDVRYFLPSKSINFEIIGISLDH
jgi:hypothetical protein